MRKGHKKMQKLQILILLIFICGCSQIYSTNKHITEESIKPGTYKLVMTSSGSYKKGESTIGKLWLELTSPSDKSPKTNEIPPKNEKISKVPLYGSVNIDFEKVNAPIIMYDGELNTPDSKDPIYPGVLVHHSGNQYSLTIGTVSNVRNGKMSLDGTGIILNVEVLRNGSFSGNWEEYGIVSGDRGTFEAILTEK